MTTWSLLLLRMIDQLIFEPKDVHQRTEQDDSMTLQYLLMHPTEQLDKQQFHLAANNTSMKKHNRSIRCNRFSLRFEVIFPVKQ